MQGWRVAMEDSHIYTLSAAEDSSASYFGLFDGHGGKQVSNYLAQHLQREIMLKQKDYKEGKIADAIRKGFISTDQNIKRNQHLKPLFCGSTAIVIIIKDGVIYTANLGDSRAVACVSGHSLPLSFDHKPHINTERDRIIKAGAWVKNDRVKGTLAVSRSFGDFSLKCIPNVRLELQPVSNFPDISIKEVSPDIEFIIMACDGIWDVKSNKEVIDFVRYQIGEGVSPDLVLKNLFLECIAKDVKSQYGFDNMSAVLICFLQGEPYQNFVEKCFRPRELKLDPHALLISLETGPTDSESLTPKLQRRWGTAQKANVEESYSGLQDGPSKLEANTPKSDTLSEAVRLIWQSNNESDNTVLYKQSAVKNHKFVPQNGIPKIRLYHKDEKYEKKNYRYKRK